jgi:hypothetical protein
MNKKVLNEVNRNREIMGLNEQGVVRAALDGLKRGQNKNKPESDDSEKQPISTEDFKQTVIKIYDDHITIESETPSSDRELAQKIITSVAEEKGYGQQKSRKVIQTENGGYKVIATFDKK